MHVEVTNLRLSNHHNFILGASLPMDPRCTDDLVICIIIHYMNLPTAELNTKKETTQPCCYYLIEVLVLNSIPQLISVPSGGVNLVCGGV